MSGDSDELGNKLTKLRLIEGGGDLVSFIEKILERAKKGELYTLAIAEIHVDGCAASGIAWGPGEGGQMYPTLGAIRQLEYDILSGELNFPDIEDE